MEKQRFYRAVSRPITAGDHQGKRVVMTFRADNMTEASHHAAQCFRDAVEFGPLEVGRLNFFGTSEPPEMGKLHLMPKGWRGM